MAKQVPFYLSLLSYVWATQASVCLQEPWVELKAASPAQQGHCCRLEEAEPHSVTWRSPSFSPRPAESMPGPVLDTMGQELYLFVHQASQCLEWARLTNNYAMVSHQHHPTIKTVFLVRQATPPAKLADQQVCEYTTPTGSVCKPEETA